ncbi:MAG TPA: carboxypeptidase-like regulatory domain-containing protein, partial [Edaphobacter sp.]
MKFSRVFRTISLVELAILIAVCLAFTAPTARGQGYARISGTVNDSTGAAVPNAHVTATNVNTNVQTSVESSGDGSFVFPSLAPAQYSISVSAAGFASFVQHNIVLQADQAVTVNVSLQIGATSQTVDVSAAPPQVDTSTGTLSQVITQSSVNDLPLNGRNAAALTTLVAGVVIAPNAQADQGATKTFPVAVTVTANGTRVGQMNYLLDGGNNVDEYTNVNAPFPMPDSLQEFSVQTSNYNAQYGQNAGGVVDIVTRSGTSQYHGGLFWFGRNRAFNAANYFSYVNGVKTVDPLKRNQFGGTFGGPVAIPRLFHLNSGFFFVGYQKTIRRTQATSNSAAILPSNAQLAGTFAGENACIVNPLQPTHNYPCTQTGSTQSGAPIYTTQVNTADFSSVSQKLLTYLPSGGATGSYIFRKPTNDDFGEITARYDQAIGDRDRLTVRYFQDSYHLDGVLNLSNLLTYADEADIKYYNSLISHTHIFNPRIMNNLVLNYQINNASRGPLPGSINMNDLGVNIWQPAFKQINSIAVSNAFTIGDNPQGFFRRANYTLGDDLHVQLGNHNLAFGFHAENSKVDVDNLYRQPGTFSFNSNNTGFDPVLKKTAAGDSLASFLFGYMNEFQQASGQFLNLRGHFYGFYGQDSWKVSRNFTLNYGLRYEPFFPWHEKEGRMGGFNPALWASNTHSQKYPLAPAGLQFAGDPGFNSNGVPNIYTHFMPRVGFAWDVFGAGKTSVRGGAGMFFDTRLSSVFFNIYSNTSPFITNVDVTNTTGAKITFADPYG